jgi:hypothetical protein
LKPNFQTDLKRGQAGEHILHTLLPHLEKMGRTADFRCNVTGCTFEVKADYTATDNFFMERWSDVEKKKPGGPWRSKEENVQFYVYLFPKEGIGYTFSTKKLVSVLEKMQGLRMVSIANRAWITKGLLVPKEKVINLAHKFTFEALK